MERREVLKAIGVGIMVKGIEGRMQGLEMSDAPEEAAGPLFELRVYHTAEGKLEALLARFRDHTVSLFKRHGIISVAYWTPTDEPLKSRTLFYIVKHPSRAAAAANWKAFSDDPEWQTVKNASEAPGKIVDSIDSTYLALTDFSPAL